MLSLVYKKILSQLMIFISLSIEKFIVPISYCAPFVPSNLLYSNYVEFVPAQFPGCCLK